MMSTTWIKSKAASYATGWQTTFNGAPTTRNIALGLAVAIHETNAGSAWPDENNWGAVQKRSPNADELAIIVQAGVDAGDPWFKQDPKTKKWLSASPQTPGAIRGYAPHPANVDRAREALENAITRGQLHAPENAALHVDSSPGKGWYWMFFWAFDTEAEGAALFVKILAKNRPSCKTVLEDPAGTSHQLAGAMYRSRYFEGFRKPASWYKKIDAGNGKGPTWTVVIPSTEGAVLGSDLNIGDYGGACQRIYVEVMAALTATTPIVVPPATTKRRTIRRGDQDLRLVGSDVRDAQIAFGVEPDGRFGPKTEAAAKVFQLAHDLVADGIVGKNTWAVIDATPA